MLTPQGNDLLCRVGGDALKGQIMRTSGVVREELAMSQIVRAVEQP